MELGGTPYVPRERDDIDELVERQLRTRCQANHCYGSCQYCGYEQHPRVVTGWNGFNTAGRTPENAR